MRTARSLGVTDAEIDRLCDAVVQALGRGPLEPDALREAAGAAVRSLGDAGVKKGLSSTMPVALGRLQNEGEIPPGRHQWPPGPAALPLRAVAPQPLRGFKASADEVNVELARRYFRWIGPATSLSSSGSRVRRQGGEGSGCAPRPRRGGRGRRPDPAGRTRRVRAVPGAAHGKPRAGRQPRRHQPPATRPGRLLDPADTKRLVLSGKAVSEFGGLADLPSHAILDRGRVVGLWEYDTGTSSIAWRSFVPVDHALEQAVARTEAFVRDQLGDARSFSLDTPKSRAPRIASIRTPAVHDRSSRVERSTVHRQPSRSIRAATTPCGRHTGKGYPARTTGRARVRARSCRRRARPRTIT